MRVAALISHPIQYYAPIFRELARRGDLHVFYGQRIAAEQQAQSGFGVAFDWDVDLMGGYASSFLTNVARRPGPDHFLGCDTPDVGRELKAGGFDALLLVGWYLKSFIQATIAAKRLGLPVVVRGDSHLGMPTGAIKKAVKDLAFPGLLRVFDGAAYVGERSRAFYRRYGYPDARLFRSPHCIDTEWFAAGASSNAGPALRARLGIDPAAKVLLFAGKLVPFKRPLDVIDAAGQLRAAGLDLQVLVAGSGELESALRERAAASGVPTHMLGFQNQSQMPAVYAAADVLALPSTGRETWGLVANEALACGTPIVVSDAVGCAPDLAVGEVGRTFPLADVGALARCVEEVLRSPPRPEAIQRVSDAYGLSAAVDGIQEALLARRAAQGGLMRW